MDDRTIYLAPASNERAYEHLSDTVIEGLPADTFTDRKPSQDRFHIWGVKEEIEAKQGFKFGDILLFYTGDKKYTQAAVIKNKEKNEELARSLWGTDDTNSTKDTEPWSRILHLDPPIEVDIDSGKIADYADYGIDYVLGLQSLNEQGHETIIEEFGSIHEFIADHAVDRSPAEVYERAPGLRLGATESEPSQSTQTRTGSESGETTDVTTRWTKRCQRIENTLDRAVNVALTGPPHAISTEQAYQIGRWWLEQHQQEIDSRILSVSIDDDTGYDDFVERPFGTTETADSVTTTDGAFKRACRLAKAAKTEAQHDGLPIPQFLLLVNAESGVSVANALGPIRHVLDESTRRREPTIQLPHSGETLPVPQNLTIVTVTEVTETSMIPSSTHRHFRVIDVSSDIELLAETYGYGSLEEAEQTGTDGDRPLGALTVAAVAAINNYLATQIDTRATLGQDLFIAYDDEAEVASAPGQYANETLRDIWEFTAFPQLRTTIDTRDDRLHSILEEFGNDGIATSTEGELEEVLQTIVDELPPQ